MHSGQTDRVSDLDLNKSLRSKLLIKPVQKKHNSGDPALNDE
ncbi:12411_t:CDS:2 [Racocetra fulgida]|uniref:12411_t:CDS:1 n=1 Tax=Racocetra fulgida TaxID=60492 RepID=A0A9N9F0G0_9GLOM|nr:12411_t:CDS:2 [Racocetra fulgida]